MGLQNNYEMYDFERLQQDALIALVACCPKQAAPWVTFKLYMVGLTPDLTGQSSSNSSLINTPSLIGIPC